MAQNHKTIEQQIAAKEAELARLRAKQRKLENGQKIILGGLLLNEVQADAKVRNWLLRKVAETVTREVDKKRLASLVAEWQAMGNTLSASSRASESTQEGTERKT